MEKLKKLLGLFLTMFKIGLFTFGGGYAMIALLENEFVEKKKLLEVFDRYQTFPRGDLNLKHDVENDQLYSEILEEGIGLIAKCNNALYQILTGVTVDDAMVEEYNGCVSRVNEYSEAYGFSKVKADAVKIEGLTRKNITMRYIPQLQNVMLDYSQKAEKSIRD